MLNFKFSPKDFYNKVTPVFWRKVGDACLIIGGTVTTSYLSSKHDSLMALGLIATVLGKLITDCFCHTDESK